MVVARIERHAQSLSGSLRPGDNDLTQLGDNRFAENKPDRLGRACEPGIGGWTRPEKSRVEECRERGARYTRHREAGKKNRRPVKSTAPGLAVHGYDTPGEVSRAMRPSAARIGKSDSGTQSTTHLIVFCTHSRSTV